MKMQIIPAIDLIDGKCVRLSQGDFSQKTLYHDNPVEVAKNFEQAGIKRLHLVDLDGARQKKIVNWKVLENITNQTSLHVDFGGGVQSDQDIQIAFDCGAKQITGGSIAVKNPEIFEKWLKNYGSEKIILGADVKNEYIAVGGWEETSQLSLWDFLANYTQKTVRYTICTDVSKDGLLQGTATDLYRRMKEKFAELQIIASGGVSGVADLEELEKIGVFGVIIGKAIYENKISLADLKRFL